MCGVLINRLGTEDDDEVTHLDDHRIVPDPRNRETITSLLAAALNPVPRSELLARPSASVTNLDSPPAAVQPDAASDVA